MQPMENKGGAILLKGVRIQICFGYPQQRWPFLDSTGLKVTSRMRILFRSAGRILNGRRTATLTHLCHVSPKIRQNSRFFRSHKIFFVIKSMRYKC